MICWSIWAHAPIDMAPGCYFTPNHPSTPTNPQTLFIPASDTAAFEAHGGKQIWGNLLKAYTDRNGPICWDPSIRYYFLALLLILQILCCIWFLMIAKIIYKVLNGTGADDVRSDDEGDEEDDLIDDRNDRTRTIYNGITTCTESGLSAMPAYKEEEVGVDALTFARLNGASQRRQNRSSTAPRASGISIPGHGDHKELLGRIGCDKPS